MKEPPHPLLAHGKVRHVGDPVAIVMAETRAGGQEAAETIVVDYEILPAVVGVLDAIKPGAPQLFDDAPGNVCFDWEVGDEAATDAAFAKAASRAPDQPGQQPPGRQPDGAARGDRRIRPATGEYTL